MRRSWLTTVLREAGTLPQGTVNRMRPVEMKRTAGGTLTRLEVQYSKGAPIDLPRRIIVKLPRTGRPKHLLDAIGRKEVAFYRTVALTIPGVRVPRCLAANWTGDGEWYVVLEDLSESHTQTQWPLPPTDASCAAAVDALAALHAALWNSPRLETDLGGFPTAQQVEDNTTRATDLAFRFVDFLGDRLSPDRQRCFAQVVDGLPRLWDWWLRPETRTLVHGDAHAWNLLFPRVITSDAAGASDEASVVLIDWQNWQVGPPTFDLATFMVLDWYPERRARLEGDLLRRYHRLLCERGVRDYEWYSLWRDYRLGAANTLFTCAWRWDNGTEAQHWWPHLEAALSAFQDLECERLLVK